MRRRRAWPTAASLGDRAAVALGVVLLGLFAATREDTPADTSHGFDVGAGLLLATSVALLALRRRFPATVALLLVGLSVVWYSRYTSRFIDLPALVGFYTLGTTGDRARQLGVGGATVALLLLGAAGDARDLDIAVEGVGWTVAAILAGELVRNRRLLLEHYAERAARAEAERDSEAERRVAEERLRIARDLHDVLAHTVSIMTVQAGVAGDAVDRDPGAVRSALATLREAGKDAMAEVRATVALLRGGDRRADTAPAPGLGRVDELVEAARDQGLDVEMTVDGAGGGADDLVELTAYRVVQESLTNVVRHAGASRAAVHIHRGPSALVVEVADDGRTAAPPGRDRAPGPGPGFGLRGMGERVEAVGGELSYGPLPGRGWAVRAVLPTREGRP